MEWVETTAKTVEDAKEAALDQLGVDEQDAEFEVVEEPRSGLFGRVRGEARVRARVRPTSPRQKQERSDRRRRGAKAKVDDGSSPKTAAPRATTTAGSTDPSGESDGEDGRRGGQPGAHRRPPRARRSDSGSSRPDDRRGAAAGGAETMGEPASVEDQAEVMTRFLQGLVVAFDAVGSVEQRRIDDDTIELAVTGEDLGLLVGPKGATLQAIQDLARTVVQRQLTGEHHGRVRIDIAGYRERRRAALERFTHQVAEDVRTNGVAKALEPMHAADRKVVHDAINEIEGVSSSSEGEEPRRRVVINPA